MTRTYYRRHGVADKLIDVGKATRQFIYITFLTSHFPASNVSTKVSYTILTKLILTRFFMVTVGHQVT